MERKVECPKSACEHHIRLIKKGLRAAKKGDFVPDAEMKKLMARMRRTK